MSKTAVFAVLVGVVALYLALSFRSVSKPAPIVTLQDGKLQGRLGHSREGQEYFEYLSIPFAEPPVGDLRFEAPVPLKKPWSGIKQATTYPPFCLQMDTILRGKLYGEEDCLYLNVFTRTLEGKLPVMVYFHGGGFVTGAANIYHPEFFMDEEIILITCSYRLGPLGFMNLEDGLIRGNMGLKDQNLVLKWVQENIANFGGDPGKVTIFGESAGAGSVEYHMISPLSKGLFHRAILQSGSVNCPWAFRRNPRDTAMKFIKNTECSKETGDKLVQCLKRIDAVDLVKQSASTMDPTNPLLLFVPTAETVLKDDTFLVENPREILKSGTIVNNVAAIYGFTSGEGALRTARIDAMSDLIPKMDKNWNELAARLLYFDDADIPAETATKIRDKYFNRKSFTGNLHEFKKTFSKMASDGIFFEPIQRAAMLHAKSGAPTYMYFYDYDHSSFLPSVYSLLRAVRNTDDWILADLRLAYASFVDIAKKKLEIEGPHEFAITHGDDMLMLWNMEGWTGQFAEPDKPFSKAFVKVFVDFAKNKKPLEFNGVRWPAIDQEESLPNYMLISKQPKIITEPFSQNTIRFWESLKIRE